MMTFAAYASNFDFYPKVGEAFAHLAPLLGKLKRIDFILRVNDPLLNQGQMASDFDEALETALHSSDARPHDLRLPQGVSQELDFAFTFNNRTVAVECEKTNREKILRDILKCHMYLHAGADFALVVLPKNYCHSHGVWNLFDFGLQRLAECQKYGFGTPENLGRILLLGYEQFDSKTERSLCMKTRQEMRKQAERQPASR